MKYVSNSDGAAHKPHKNPLNFLVSSFNYFTCCLYTNFSSGYLTNSVSSKHDSTSTSKPRRYYLTPSPSTGISSTGCRTSVIFKHFLSSILMCSIILSYKQIVLSVFFSIVVHSVIVPVLNSPSIYLVSSPTEQYANFLLNPFHTFNHFDLSSFYVL